MKKALGGLGFWVALPLAGLGLTFAMRSGTLAICFYTLFLLLALSRLMTLFWLRPLSCEREISDDVVKIGDVVKVTCRLRNLSPWPILWLYAEETLPEKMPVLGTPKRLLFLPPGRSFYLSYSITMMARGCHRLGPVVMESGDVFGLFKRSRIDRRRDFVTVLPAYHVIEEFQVGRQRRLGDMGAMRSIFEDPTSIRGVREYRRGDALKRIHWKATARTGNLMSKIYDPVLEAGATIVLDFHRETWKKARSFEEGVVPSEMAIEIACTICRYLSDGGWKVGFFSNGRDPLGLPGISMAEARATDSLGEALEAARMGLLDERLAPISIRARRSAEQFALIHENMGRLELSDGLAIEELLLEELAHIERTQALVFVTGDVPDGFVAGVLRAREIGYRIMVFVVCNNEAHDRAFEFFLPHGIEVYRMDEDWRLKEIATGRQFI